METVFIAGSIAIKRLDAMVRSRISNAVDRGMAVIVGDADGADKSIQEYLQIIGAENVTIFCSGDRLRNNVGGWPVQKVSSDAVPGTRAFFTAKDVKMAENADYGLMIWDTKSTGTLSNVIELLKAKKKSVVFVNKAKDFVTVSDAPSLETLLGYMSESAKSKAEGKIKLSSKLASLAQEQLAMHL